MTSKARSQLARQVLLLCGWLVAMSAFASPPHTRVLDTGWTFRLLPGNALAHAHAKATQWHPATVPGSVHTDLLTNHLIADPYGGAAEAGLQWIGLGDWEYRTQFDVDAASLAQRHHALVFDGLDTFAEVWLNGKRLLSADNMFRRWRVPLHGVLKAHGNSLRVVLHSPISQVLPMVQALTTPPLPGAYATAFDDEPEGLQTANYVRKAGYHYGWDWGPRYVTLGIWKPVILHSWDTLRVSDFHVGQTAVSAAEADLAVTLDIESDRAGSAELALDWRAPDGSAHALAARRMTLQRGANHVAVPVRIADPQRWYPNGYGAPALYTFHARIRDAAGLQAEVSRRTGLRRVELRRARDADGHGMEFVVNGIPVFAKGANVIPFDMFPARVTRAQQRRILQSAHDAHMNMLRAWGGGYYPDDAFFDLADELGLMVWQDFAFGQAMPPAYDADFRATVLAEAHQQILRLRDHPSLVLWCGNNEVETSWLNWGNAQAMRAADPVFAQRVWNGYRQLFGHDLRALVAREGNGVAYWSSSPGSDGDAGVNVANDSDMHSWDVWAGSAPITDYLKLTPRFMSEYGLESWPSLRTLRAVLAPADLRMDAPAWRAHQKFDHGNGDQRLLHYIRAGYGESVDLAAFVYLSQVMQAEGIELAVLHLRSSRPRTMGSLYWQLNDVWPGASWSGIDWYGRWKPLQFHARRFYAPVLVAPVRRDGVTTVRLVSDRSAPLHGQLRLRVLDFDGRVLHEQTRQVTLAALASTVQARYTDAQLLHGADRRHTLAVFDLSVGARLRSRQYVYFGAAKDLALPDPGLHAVLRRDGTGYALKVHAARLARALWIDFGDLDATLADNALTLLPGQTVTLHVDSTAGLDALRAHLHLRSLYAATKPKGRAARSASDPG